VADRFHVRQNVGMALDRLLIREHRVRSRVARSIDRRLLLRRPPPRRGWSIRPARRRPRT
jgi:hypothetical protein